MKNSFLLAALAIGTLTAASCEKDKSVTMRTERISKGSWQLRSVFKSMLGMDDSNITNQSTAYLNNLYQFDQNGDILRFRAVAGLDTPKKSGTWTFREADTRITLTDTTLAGDYEVATLNDTIMVLKSSFTPENGTTPVYTTKTLRRAQ